MATAKRTEKIKEIRYSWAGKDKSGKAVKGEIRAAGTAVASAQLRRLESRFPLSKKPKPAVKLSLKRTSLYLHANSLPC